MEKADGCAYIKQQEVSNAMFTGKAGILTTKEMKRGRRLPSQVGRAGAQGNYVWSTETSPSTLLPNNVRITLSRRTST
jgi:hypothetical protein